MSSAGEYHIIFNDTLVNNYKIKFDLLFHIYAIAEFLSWSNYVTYAQKWKKKRLKLHASRRTSIFQEINLKEKVLRF
jgi:hypothetical protein